MASSVLMGEDGANHHPANPMKSNQQKDRTPLPPLMRVSAAIGILLLAWIPLWYINSNTPKPLTDLPDSPQPTARGARLRDASELSDSERLWVAGAMAGSGCQVTTGKASQEAARAAYDGMLTAKGIDPQSTWNDEQLKQMSRQLFVEMCR